MQHQQKTDEALVSHMTMIAALLLVAGGMLRCVCMSDATVTTAAAQQRTPASRSEQGVVLGRYCVKEAGFWPGTDCLIIGQVLKRVGDGDVVAGAHVNGRGKLFDPLRLGDRPWIAGLARDGAQPPLWPTRLSWNHYRDPWLAVIEQALAIVRDVGANDPVCVGKYIEKTPAHRFASDCGARADGGGPTEVCSPAMQWGGLMDHYRARRFGWMTLECGPSPPNGRSPRGNLAYARPSIVSALDAAGRR